MELEKIHHKVIMGTLDNECKTGSDVSYGTTSLSRNGHTLQTPDICHSLPFATGVLLWKNFRINELTIAFDHYGKPITRII